MAPEQILCPDDWAKPTVDVYALGIILYELLTGRLPFEGKSTFELFKKIENEDPTPVRKLNRNVSRDLEAICLKCLEKNPKSRYGAAKAIADDLNRFLRREAVTARRTGSLVRIKKWTLRNRWQVSLGAAFVAAAIFLTSLLLNIRDQRQAAYTDYQLSFDKAQQLFEQAKSTGLRNLDIWEQASEEMARAVEIQQENPQLADKQSLDLLGDIDSHRSARQFFREIDDLSLDFTLKTFQPFDAQDFQSSVTDAMDQFGLGRTNHSVVQEAERLRTLDETTLNAVTITIYRLLLLDEELEERDWCERLLLELDSNSWRKDVYKAVIEKDVSLAKRLIEQPDFSLDPITLADSLGALHLDGSSDQRSIIESLKAALLRNPTSFWLNYQLSLFIQRCEHPSNALPYARAAMAQRQSPAMRLRLGRMYSQMREFNLAIQEYMEVLEQDPENVTVYRYLAETYRGKQDYENSIKYYKLAIENDSQGFYIRGSLLKAYIESGQRDAARKYAAELISRDSTDHETYYSKAVAYAQMGKVDLAIENYQLALDIRPRCHLCLIELAEVYFRNGQMQEAQSALEEFLQFRPSDVRALQMMMEICKRLKDYDSAERFAKRRLAIVPHAPGYLLDLAEIYNKSGQFDLAEEAYIKSQSFIKSDDETNPDRDNVKALEQLAILYNSQNRTELAETTARRAIRIRPGAQQANFLLVQILTKQQRLEDALEIADAFVKNQPDSIYSYACLLNTLVEMERYDEAIEAFHAGRRNDTDPPRFFNDARLSALKEKAANGVDE